MNELGAINVAIGATVEEAGFARAVNALGGIEVAAATAASGATASLNQIGAAVDTMAGRYVDANGRLRESNGRFVSAARLAAEAAARNGGSLGTLADAADGAASSINGQLVAALRNYDAASKPLEDGIGRIGEATQSLGQSLTVGVTLPLTALAAGAVKTAGDMQALEKGFAATYRGSEQLGDALVKVKELAKLPGLGLEEALQGATNLQAAGFSADLARRALGAFGNALATVGKGKADLDGVGLALGQIASKGKISAEEINQLAERVPQIRGAIQAAFGTADTTALQKLNIDATTFVEGITAELEKLPKVTGGINNALENFGDVGVTSLAKLGDAFNKAFDIEGLLDSLSASLTSAADSFAALDPGTQKLIFGLAGAAAAAGPLLVAVGGILAIVPQVVAGFGLVSGALEGTGAAALAFATGPVGIAIAALAALAAGLYYLSTAGERAIDTYQEQARQTGALTEKVMPLLSRYQELADKTNLTAQEQAELTSLIQQLAQAVPGAVTAIDAYGKATGISTGAVASYVAALQQQKQAQAALALPAAQAELDKLSTKYRVLKEQADEFNRTGAIKVAVFDEGGGSLETYRAGSKAVLELQANLANANVDVEKQRSLVDELSRSVGSLGSTISGTLTPALTDADIALKFLGGQGVETGGRLAGLRKELEDLKKAREEAPTDALTKAYNPLIAGVEKQIAALEGSTKKGKDALADLQKVLADNGRQSVALGADYDYLGNQQKLVESGIKNLITAGYDPAGRVVQGYVAKLRELNQVLGDNSLLSLRAAKGVKELFVTPEFKLDVPKLDGLEAEAPVLPDYKFIFGQAARDIAAGTGGIQAEFTHFSQAQADFNTNSEALADMFPAQAFDTIGQSVGEALASGADVITALGAGVLKAASQFLQEYGRLILLKGAADIAFGNVGQGLLELAAGAALVAGAGLASGLASNASAGGTSLASQPRTNLGTSAAGGTQQINIVAEFKLRGQDLVAVSRTQDYRSLRTS